MTSTGGVGHGLALINKPSAAHFSSIDHLCLISELITLHRTLTADKSILDVIDLFISPERHRPLGVTFTRGSSHSSLLMMLILSAVSGLIDQSDY